MDIVFLSVDRFEILVPTGNELASSILPQERAESNRKAAKWSEVHLPLPQEV